MEHLESRALGKPKESVTVDTEESDAERALRELTPEQRLPHLPTPPAASSVPPGPGQLVLHTSASAPVEWILLSLAIIALGFAAWLWSRWGRSRPPSVPA
jgi:hypothetical protein